MQNKIQILCTKTISNTFIEFAEEHNILIDQMNFIEIKAFVSEEIKKRILELSGENIPAIFTSSNAVNAVEKVTSAKLNWKIYCIEPATKKTIETLFPGCSIEASAKDADELSEKIIADKAVKEVVFFCGNQRRELLPERLKNNRIKVEELIVYKTTETPQSIKKKYDGILFFSPSGVRSFFSTNLITTETVLFTIGKTTADAVQQYSNNTIIIAEIPDTKKLIAEVVKHFSNKK